MSGVRRNGIPIGDLAARSGLNVRTLRFYADAGVLPEAGRTPSGYRLFDADAVARARLVRTLRELGVGLDDVRRVLAAESSLAEVAAAHADALDAQIRTLRLRRAVLRTVARTADPEELEQMTDLTTMTEQERRRILEDYLDAVFGDADNPVAARMRAGAPELPDDPTPEQTAAWVELVGLLRDPGFVATGRQLAEQARAPRERGAHEPAEVVGELAGRAARDGVDPASSEALVVLERIEAAMPGEAAASRAVRAAHVEAFTDRRVFRYWELVGIVNGWQREPAPQHGAHAWEWYAAALRAHAG